MASAVSGFVGGNGSASHSWFKMGKGRKKEKASRNVKVWSASSSSSSSSSSFSVMDPYKTLRIHPGASESEVKRAFRKLALQFHPDVCRMNDCELQFCQINEAYNIVMSNLREESSPPETLESPDDDVDRAMSGSEDAEWEPWEEWMGWEGAGIRDYSSHINPYI